MSERERTPARRLILQAMVELGGRDETFVSQASRVLGLDEDSTMSVIRAFATEAPPAEAYCMGLAMGDWLAAKRGSTTDAASLDDVRRSLQGKRDPALDQLWTVFQQIKNHDHSAAGAMAMILGISEDVACLLLDAVDNMAIRPGLLWTIGVEVGFAYGGTQGELLDLPPDVLSGHYAHMGCPACGFVAVVISIRDDGPYCTHTAGKSGRYVFTDRPEPEWTRMVPAKVYIERDDD